MSDIPLPTPEDLKANLEDDYHSASMGSRDQLSLKLRCWLRRYAAEMKAKAAPVAKVEAPAEPVKVVEKPKEPEKKHEPAKHHHGHK